MVYKQCTAMVLNGLVNWDLCMYKMNLFTLAHKPINRLNINTNFDIYIILDSS